MAFTLSGDAATTRTNLGLGDAATKTTGTASGNIPVLDSSGQIADAQIAALSVSKLSGVGTSGQVLTSNGTGSAPTMQAAAGGGVLQVKNTIYTGSTSYNSTSWGQMTSNLDVTITPSGADKSFYIEALLWCSPQNHDTGYVFNIADSQVGTTTGIFPNHANNGSAIGGYAGLHSWAAISAPDQYQLSPIPISGFYTPTSNNASARTFNIIGRKTTSTGSVALHINIQASNVSGDRSILACSNITVWEIENGIYS